MDEIAEIHNNTEEWKTLLNLANRIADVEEKIGPWDDLTNMVVSILEKAKACEPESIATTTYPFLFRLYFRIKSYQSPVPFNRVSASSRLAPLKDNPQYSEEAEGFAISNYDYKTYLWARSLGQTDFISNDSLWIPRSVLTPAQIKRLDQSSKT